MSWVERDAIFGPEVKVDALEFRCQNLNHCRWILEGIEICNGNDLKEFVRLNWL